MRRLAVGGVHYAVREWGAGPPVVLLHGFTGTGALWAPHAARLAHAHRVLAVDLLGHGASDAPADPARYRMERLIADLCGLFDACAVARAAVLGYSMGGRVALAFAIAHPKRVTALVLESASPGIEDAVERAERAGRDEALAARLERNGVAAFVDEWMTQPLFATQARLGTAALAAAREQRLIHSARGLANALRGVGTGAQPSYWTRLADVAVPTLLITGEHDAKFHAIAREMRPRLPAATLALIPDAGHATHLENPDAFAHRVAAFLQHTRTARDAAASGAEHHIARAPSAPRCAGVDMPIDWQPRRTYGDILYEVAEGIAKITINRPEVRNAFRPQTVMELLDAFAAAREDREVGVIILTGAGTEAFCSGGDQRVRGDAGYVGDDGVPRLNVLDLQRLIRTIPKPVIAMVAGYAIGGGHVLHMLCDLTIAAENARFGQTGPRVGSFDGGYGATYMARLVGHKKAREIWYLCRQYTAAQALDMGLINAVVPLERLEEETVQWAREILANSPMAIRCLKAAFNADTDGLAGIQELAGNATLLFYMSEEGQEGRNAYLEKRRPDFSKFPRLP